MDLWNGAGRYGVVDRRGIVPAETVRHGREAGGAGGQFYHARSERRLLFDRVEVKDVEEENLEEMQDSRQRQDGENAVDEAEKKMKRRVDDERQFDVELF